MERGSLEVCGLEFGKALPHKKEAVMRNYGVGRAFLSMAIPCTRFLSWEWPWARGTEVEEVRRRRVAGNET